MNQTVRPARPPAEAARAGRRRRRDLADHATIGLFLLAVLVALHAAASLVVPMVAAVVAGSVLARLGDRGQRIGIPPVAAGMGLVALTALGLVLAVDLLAEPVAAFGARLPAIVDTVGATLGTMLAPVEALKGRLNGGAAPGGADAGPPLAPSLDLGWLSGLAGGLTPALGEILVFLATLVFFVAGRAALRRRAILAIGDRDRRLAALRISNAAEAALARYFGIAAAIYLGVAIATGCVAGLFGLGSPVLLGALTFVMSFVPFLGAAVVTVVLAAAGMLVHDGIAVALLPAGLFVIVHLVCENAVIPSVLGRRFEINPFLVFVSIVFWTWMWGAMGAVLAVPLLLVARAIRLELRESGGPALPD